MERLPVYVYGTLRPGEGNWSLLASRATHVGRARLADHALYASGGLPFAVADPGAEIIGDLVEVDDAGYEQVLGDLDRLEGYRAGRPTYLYERRSVTVALEGEPRSCRAWAYIVPDDSAELLGNRHLVADGDWRARSRVA